MHILRCCIFFVATFFTIAVSAQKSKNPAFGDVSEEIRRDILTIFLNGTVHALGNCTGADNSAPATEFWVYTQDNPNDPQIVKEPNIKLTSERSKIIFLAHGWQRSADAINIVGIKNAYLSVYNAFVISVNWESYSMQTYTSAVCALSGVAHNVANFMCDLKQNLNVSLNEIHAVGHSLGGQLFGQVGSFVYKQCGEKLGRITGLDPAGPLYDGTNTKNRLDPSDALFVDVIHTTVGQAGFLGSCGHLDVYPNCGYYQPGCAALVFDRDVLKNDTSLLELPLDFFTCSHERSCNYFEESITLNNYIARQCTNCGSPLCYKTPLSWEKKVIGEYCTKPGRVRDYVLYTHSTAPFAKP